MSSNDEMVQSSNDLLIDGFLGPPVLDGASHGMLRSNLGLLSRSCLLGPRNSVLATGALIVHGRCIIIFSLNHILSI